MQMRHLASESKSRHARCLTHLLYSSYLVEIPSPRPVYVDRSIRALPHVEMVTPTPVDVDLAVNAAESSVLQVGAKPALAMKPHGLFAVIGDLPYGSRLAHHVGQDKRLVLRKTCKVFANNLHSRRTVGGTRLNDDSDASENQDG